MKQRGFVLLLSALIVTTGVIVIGVAVALHKISLARQVVNADLGSKNFATAQACLEEAVYRHQLADGGYAGGAVILNGQSCTIGVQSGSLPPAGSSGGSGGN